jgi:hypothetical protein
MKISKKLAFGAAVVAILSAAFVHAAGSCDSRCAQIATDAYNQVMKNYPPQPGAQMCATVAEPYKSQCIASIDAQRATGLAQAQSAYDTAYGTCMSSCRP